MPPTATPTNTSSAAQEAEVCRKLGNLHYKNSRFSEAIAAYTKAIKLNPNVPVYWTNRALCHSKTNAWTRVEDDCRKAILLDNNCIKAHRLLGLALLERKEYKEALKGLEKALELGKCMNLDDVVVEEIWQKFATAKYMEWEYESDQRSLALNMLKMECEEALRKKLGIEASLEEVSSTGEQCYSALVRSTPHDFTFTYKFRQFFEKISHFLVRMNCLKDSRPMSKYQALHTCTRDNMKSPSNIAGHTHVFHGTEELEALDLVFKKAKEEDTPSKVPDYLCCTITLDILRDPVIAPSGFTYERSAILEHLKKLGNFDPITRQPVTSSQLIPNLAVKEAVRVYLDKHGWAYGLD